MRVHTGEMPYSCASCDKVFRYACNLRRHEALAHQGGRRNKRSKTRQLQPQQLEPAAEAEVEAEAESESSSPTEAQAKAAPGVQNSKPSPGPGLAALAQRPAVAS